MFTAIQNTVIEDDANQINANFRKFKFYILLIHNIIKHRIDSKKNGGVFEIAPAGCGLIDNGLNIPISLPSTILEAKVNPSDFR